MEGQKTNQSALYISGIFTYGENIETRLPLYLHSTGVHSLPAGAAFRKNGVQRPFVELLWNISGIGKVRLFEKTYTIGENHTFYYLPGEDYELHAITGNWNVRWLCFSGRLAESILLAYGYPRLQKAVTDYPKALFAEIERLISNRDLFSLRLGGAKIMEVLAGMGERKKEFQSGKLVDFCKDYIHSHLQDPQLSLSMIADAMRVSGSLVSRVFKKECSVSPGRYVLNCRMQLALSLLKGTDLPMAEVAESCGFSDRHTFTRFVKRATGASPREIREIHKFPVAGMEPD